MNKHKGFTLKAGETKVSDSQLLGESDDTISMMMNNRTYLEYLSWKLIILKKRLVERVEAPQVTDEYSPDISARINFTSQAINHVEHILTKYASGTTHAK